MQIQWFPGHMNKARNEVKAILPKVDILIEVLDARIPYSSENPMLRELRGEKPVLKVLAKSDLADPDRTEQWLAWHQQKSGVKARALSTENIPQMRSLPSICARMLPHRVGEGKSIVAMIVGVPNVGKSTLINTLAGRTVAKTGNEPAITKGQQRIDIEIGFSLLDTPGMLWPNVENPQSGLRLAAVGSVKETAMEYEDVAAFVSKYMIEHYPDRLSERYKLDPLPTDMLEFLETLARKRGCLRKNSIVDYERVSKILVTELRSGKLGPVTLETPEAIEQEVSELEIELAAKRQSKQAKKEERKAAFKAKNKAKNDSRRRR
ncbi:MAG: ribosome biogenesis GTPase YlqF [bacterium]|nr:ribosome biogenesis GTPase YlqF [bacterium]